MNNLQTLSALLEQNQDPVVADYANRVTGVLLTAVRLAMANRPEDLELLVIDVQDFAGKRGAVHHASRAADAQEEVQNLLNRI